ncbi:hypothetical protein CSUB01_07734 [Colletotrichum sublineola]|uniref:Uncharacterized protein n=1 Tax=Colletotrichum sublineola TaxID=1173701 RepID=A0A066X2D3_COLSU|nr:hypothetical protein CSUB01_07734 [Colletotrichum sublineola]
MPAPNMLPSTLVYQNGTVLTVLRTYEKSNGPPPRLDPWKSPTLPYPPPTETAARSAPLTARAATGYTNFVPLLPDSGRRLQSPFAPPPPPPPPPPLS